MKKLRNEFQQLKDNVSRRGGSGSGNNNKDSGSGPSQGGSGRGKGKKKSGYPSNNNNNKGKNSDDLHSKLNNTCVKYNAGVCPDDEQSCSKKHQCSVVLSGNRICWRRHPSIEHQ